MGWVEQAHEDHSFNSMGKYDRRHLKLDHQVGGSSQPRKKEKSLHNPSFWSLGKELLGSSLMETNFGSKILFGFMAVATSSLGLFAIFSFWP